MREWPLRGREALLAAVVDDVAGGRGVVLVGAAGVGKSRLARAVVDGLGGGYDATWAATSRALRQISFAALLPCVDDADGAPADRTALVQGLWRGLRSGGSRRRLLVVDDAHDLDEASAGLVRQLVLTGTSVVLTVRAGEPVAEDLARLWRDRHLRRVVVDAFDPGAVRAVLEGALGGPVDVLTAARLHEWTAGNALHLRELVDAGLAAGRLCPVRRVWRWIGGPVIGDALEELINTRLSVLGEDELEALAAVAIADPAPPDVLAVMVDEEPIHRLRRAGLCRVDDAAGAATVRLVHPLYVGPALAAVSPATVVRLRRAYVKALAEAGPAAGLVGQVRLGLARLDAGEVPSDEELIAAAHAAVELSDGALAERFSRAVIRPRTDQLLVLARGLSLQGFDGQAADLLAGVTAPGQTGSDGAALAVERARFLSRAGRWDDALAILDAVTERSIDIDLSRTAVKVNLHRYAEAMNDLERRLLPMLRDGLRRQPTPRAAFRLYYALLGLTPVATEVGRPAYLVEQVEPVLDLPGRMLAPGYRAQLLLMRSYSLNVLGRLAEAAQDATEARDVYLAAGDGISLKLSLLHLALVEASHGSYRAAAALVQDGFAISDAPLARDFDNLARCWLASWQAAAGEFPPPGGSLDDALAAMPPARPGCFSYEQRLWCTAFAQACCNRSRQARATLENAADACEQGGLPGRGIEALHLLARLGKPAQAAQRLPAFTDHAQSPVWQAQARHIRALADRDPAALLQVSDAFEHLRMWHLAAEAADTAADLHASHQAPGRLVAAAATRRDGLLSRCDTDPLPWWPARRHPGLTRRELEIAHLAAAGMQTRQIAARLVVSTRTVENHLQHVYDKLGVRGRRELAARLDRLPKPPTDRSPHNGPTDRD